MDDNISVEIEEGTSLPRQRPSSINHSADN